MKKHKIIALMSLCLIMGMTLILSFIQCEVSVGLGEITVGEAPTFTMALTPSSEFDFNFTGVEGIEG